MLSKFGEMQIHSCDLLSDVISLTETWLSQHMDDRKLTIPGYQLFRRDQEGRHGGGVVIYVKHELLVSEDTEKFACSFETIWLTIKVPRSHSLEVLTVYWPSRSDLEADARLLEELEKFASRSDILITGDYYAPPIDWSSVYARGPEIAFDRRLLDMALRSFITQHVLFTRMVPRSPSLEVLTVYWPPRSDLEADAHLLDELERFASRSDILITGDYYAPHIDWSSVYARGPEIAFDRRLLDMAMRIFITQHVLLTRMVRE
ncbi:unnamed protein product [Schistocephalus solidus]|uniref:Endo/exonuclease/phosphatase domain-containing protein n=1 Tax=Schistocephalus solidus TaxID=70667 RepID=A0A183TTG6_SCHSO|nr:unnamed protein product [Schistocephalus solidus]